MYDRFKAAGCDPTTDPSAACACKIIPQLPVCGGSFLKMVNTVADAVVADTTTRTAAAPLKSVDSKAVGCCAKKITGGKDAVSKCMVGLCAAGSAYKPDYCAEPAATVATLGGCTADVAACTLGNCALHCLGGSCSSSCTSCVASHCDGAMDSCLGAAGYTHPATCDTSLKTCSASLLRGGRAGAAEVVFPKMLAR